jgi:heme oxygenase
MSVSSNNGMTLSQLLKEKTLIHHQELEKKLVGKMREMKSVYDYISLLRLFYGYIGGLEKAITPYITDKVLPDHLDRRKTILISSDLHTLNTKNPALAGGHDLPQINNTADALGALYVMEGSTLGGQIIVKMLSKQLGIDESYAMSYFSGYGEDTHKMWTVFKEALDRSGSSENEAIINSANQTFQMFSRWFDICYKGLAIIA